MKVIKSITTTDDILTFSNIDEDEYPMWVSGQAYVTSNRVIYKHKIYEAIVNVTSTTPPDLDQAKWLVIDDTNRYRMFNNVVSDKSSRMGGIHFTLTPNQVVTGLSLIGVSATFVRVVVTDPVLGVIFDETKTLMDISNIVSYFDYFYEPLSSSQTSVAFLNLPTAPTGYIDVYIDSGANEVEVAEVIYGKYTLVGKTNYGTAIGIKSFSRKETDEFGNVTVVKRRNSKYCDYDVDIENIRLSAVQKFFSDIDSVPCLFVGNEELEETIVYGFYSDFKATISYPQISKCTLKVEGLV